MIRTLQSPWLAIIFATISYLATTVLLLRPDRIGTPHPLGGPTVRLPEKLEPSWAYKNPEIEDLVAELRTERETLRQRELELNALAERLAVERQEIGTVTQRVATLQTNTDVILVQIKEDESANLRRLAKIYSTMTPEGAGKIMLELQDDAIVKLLSFMKESENALILESMGKDGPAAARRVAAITDRLRLLNPKLAPEKPKTP